MLTREQDRAFVLPQADKKHGTAFFWLTAFYFVYCARPEDWITILKYIPLAKITGICAFIGFVASLGKTKRTFRDLPKEAKYLFAIVCLLFASGFLSPIWKGGAVNHTIDFAKCYIAWLLTYLLVTDFRKLRRIIYVQASSVAAITMVSILKGHSRPRLSGVIGGIYSNPNDLAFAIDLSLPIALAFLISAKGSLRKVLWCGAILSMLAALFMTASRAGFITFLIMGTVCLWHFGVKGRRFYLIVATVVFGALILVVAGGRLKDRFEAVTGTDLNSTLDQSAYGSYEERMELIKRSFDAIEHYPILGVGVNNFVTYSGRWREVHVTYLQIAAEGGIPVLILYLMFFRRGFANMAKLRKIRDLNVEARLFVGALHASMIAFVIGACFAPEGYQYFPYITVAYSSAFLAMIRETGEQSEALSAKRTLSTRWQPEVYASRPKSQTLVPSR